MNLESTRNDLIELLIKNAAPLRTEDDWLVAGDYVRRWFADLKMAESDEKFQEAFLDSRMTVRCILQTRQTGHYSEKVPIRGHEGEGGVRTVKTMQGVAGIKARMNSSNFSVEGRENREKYEKGLFDVSAVLLDGTRSMKLGGDLSPNQMYRTTGDTLYVFMPVSSEQDMLIFCMLNLLAKSERTTSQGLKAFVGIMKSRLTRIKFAFEGDAGCKFLDFAPKGEPLPKFRYGFGKMMKGDIDDTEIRRRKRAAMEYKSILRGNNRNEIVLAYRQHGTLGKPSSFPVFAKGVFVPKTQGAPGACGSCGSHKGFVVVDDYMAYTGEIITLQGEKIPGGSTQLAPNAVPTRAGFCDCKPS